jgi:cation:H+ antiporter
MQFFLLALGLAFIIKSADVLIESASKLARRYGVSAFIVGITVVAFGTSAPELSVGIISGISGSNHLTLGDVIGSSIANMALIVGLSAVVFPLRVKDIAVRRELPILLAVQVALGAMILIDGQLSRLESIVMLGLFVLYMFYIGWDTKKSKRIQIDAEGDIDTDGDGNKAAAEPVAPSRKHELLRLWLFSLLSLLGLFIGSKLTVDSSTSIAEGFGLSQTLIGLTVVALATSMPELITSIIAARKKEPDIVLGNCIGSNILNILFVLGLSSAISPITVTENLWFDMAMIAALTVFVFVISLLRKNLRRPSGIILVFGYVAYITIKVIMVLTHSAG